MQAIIIKITIKIKPNTSIVLSFTLMLCIMIMPTTPNNATIEPNENIRYPFKPVRKYMRKKEIDGNKHAKTINAKNIGLSI